MTILQDVDCHPASDWIRIQAMEDHPAIAGRLSTRIEIQLYPNGPRQSGYSWIIVQSSRVNG